MQGHIGIALWCCGIDIWVPILLNEVHKEIKTYDVFSNAFQVELFISNLIYKLIIFNGFI